MYVPTSGMCFRKCINYFTDKDYTKECLTFIGDEKYRSEVMISARVQPFCRKDNINIGCFDGKIINRRKSTRRKMSLFLHNFQFSLIRKSNDYSFNQAMKELNLNFRFIGNVIKVKLVE